MKTRRNIKTMLIVFILLFAFLACYLIYVLNEYGVSWFSSAYNTRVDARKESVVSGAVLDATGETLAKTKADGTREYEISLERRLATAHTVGDDSGQTIGAQARFAKYLLGFDQALLDRLGTAVSGQKRLGSDVKLTINAELCVKARELLDGRKGAVILINYKTGEVLASTSSPAFDPTLIKRFVSGEVKFEDGSLVNRATMGRYTPGSTFKIVTLIAALRYIPNVENRVFTCEGPLVFDKKTGKLQNLTVNKDDAAAAEAYALLRDFEDEYHGELTLKQAFTHSCNHVFAQLALELGAAKLQSVADELMLDGEFLFDDMMAYCGTITRGETDFELAWSGVGQHKDIMTPMHMCLLSASVANGGVMQEPKLLKSVISSTGVETCVLKPEQYRTLLNEAEAATLKEYMRNVVKEGTGKRAAVEGYDVCGKTGTAEVSEDSRVLPHAWFTGFIDSETRPYAICVVVEKSGGGGTVAAPIAGTMFQHAIDLLAPYSAAE